MVKRRNLRGERTELYSPIGLLPIDAFTGGAPLGKLNVFLDIRDDGGDWRETDIREVRTPGGVIVYPGLARSREVAGQHEQHYRVRIEAEFYQPLYRLTADGIEFEANPYNDTNPPKDYPTKSEDFPHYFETVFHKVMLAPAPNYPFPDHILVLRGVVIDDETKEPGESVEVAWGNKEKTLTTGPGDDRKRVLTQASGVFGLPLRITKKEHTTTKQQIDAFDYRTKRGGNIPISIPEDLGKNNTIKIKH
jgi:hypothetical protein